MGHKLSKDKTKYNVGEKETTPETQEKNLPQNQPYYQNLPPEKDPVTSKELYIVIYDYEKRSEGELSIREGDTLEILNKDDDNWWTAKHTVTQADGYVPSNYISVLDSLDSQPWYFGNVKRNDANRYLMLPENEIGSFLVRDSLSDQKTADSTPYTLSVRFSNTIKNYRIGKNGNSWYITSLPNTVFYSVQDVINHYKQNEGLCCHLGNPSINPEKPTTAGLTHGDEWELDKSKVQLKDMIGQGQFGEVFVGIVSKERVAIKTLKPGTMQPEAFLAEATLMKTLRHKNLIQLYGVCTKDEPIYIITEFMVNGDLLDYLRKEKGKHLKDEILIDMSTQISTGMSFLEENNFIHRDLAARNVLVGENNIVKVADFGLTRLIEDDEYSARAGAKFPVKWTAPEAITFGTYSIKSDVWSFGILVFEIISKGKMPYAGTTNAQLISLLDSGYKMPKDNACPEKLYGIMLECWNTDPQKRPTFQTLTWELEDYYTNENQISYMTEEEHSKIEGKRFAY